MFLLWSALAALGLSTRALNADGDIARHLTHGRWMLEHGGVIRADPFSWTRAGDPFVGFEYGSQLLMAGAHALAGLPGVAVLAALLWAAALALVCRFMLRRGVEPGFAYLATTGIAILSAMHYAARPHLVTQVLALVLLEWLDRAERPPLWWFAGLFALWANLHGGWLFGLILVGLYGVPPLVRWLGGRDTDARRRFVGLLAAGLVGLLATCLTPYGWQVPIHVIGFMREGFIQSQTREFMPPGFRDLGTRLFLVSVLLTLAIYALRRTRPRAEHLVVVCALLAFSLMARRNIALWAMVALPLVAIHADSGVRRLPEPPNFRKSFGEAAGRPWRWRWALLPAGLLALLAVTEHAMRTPELIPREFDERDFPVDLVQQARASGVGGRLYNHFVWGGYLLHAWPEQPVFIDGGTDFYGEALLRDYLDILTLQPNWRDRIREYQVDWALVSPRSPIAGALATEPGWRRWGGDSVGVLFCRAGGNGCAP